MLILFTRFLTKSKNNQQEVSEDPSLEILKNTLLVQDTNNNTRIYLNVPYSEKEEAKSFGAKWNPLRKQWYVESDVHSEGILKWVDYDDYTLFSNYFYIAKSSRECWKCNNITDVYGLLYDEFEYANPYDEDESEFSFNEWHKGEEPFFSPLSELSNETAKRLSVINHPIIRVCEDLLRRKYAQQLCYSCNAKQGNYFIFEEIDSPLSFNMENIEKVDLYKVNLPVKSYSYPGYDSFGGKKNFVRNATVEILG